LTLKIYKTVNGRKTGIQRIWILEEWSPGVPISIRHSEPNAFARKQRYTTIDKLITAKDTSELK